MQKLDKVTLRSKQYLFDDGLVELLVGGLLGALSGLFWWQAATGAGGWVVAIAMPLVILVGGFGIGWLLRILKERFVYPRTGYVIYPHIPGNQRRRNRLLGGIFGALGGIFGTLFAVILMNTQLRIDAWIPALIGGGIGLFLLLIGFRLSLLRFQLLAIWCMAAGVLVVFLGTDETTAVALTLLLAASGLILSGAVNLWRYLTHSQPPHDDLAEVQ